MMQEDFSELFFEAANLFIIIKEKGLVYAIDHFQVNEMNSNVFEKGSQLIRAGVLANFLDMMMDLEIFKILRDTPKISDRDYLKLLITKKMIFVFRELDAKLLAELAQYFVPTQSKAKLKVYQACEMI